MRSRWESMRMLRGDQKGDQRPRDQNAMSYIKKNKRIIIFLKYF